MQLLIRASFVLLLATSGAAQQQRTCPPPSCRASSSAAVCGMQLSVNASSSANATTSCRSFENLCELQRTNCATNSNSTAATSSASAGAADIWNQTDALHCLNFRVNETRSCTCPALRTCSAATATGAEADTRICVRSGISRNCRLMRDACELTRALCAGEVWTNVDSVQCRGNSIGTAACACPRLDSCATNATDICVQNQSGCRLMRNECELVRAQCSGEAWTTADRLQCRGFNASSTTAACVCPLLQSCATNTTTTPTNICVRSPQGCRLMGSTCELERARCQGENWTRVAEIQCRGNFSLGDEAAKECACPMLDTCAAASTLSPCVQAPNNNNNCRLMANECELERALCMGETWSWTFAEQCRNFSSADAAPRNCSCPKLATCNETASGVGGGVCVHGARGCVLLRNECELERASCRGEVWTRIEAMQCAGFAHDEVRSCACPKLKHCRQRGAGVCVKGVGGKCTLMANECDLERARCGGATWTKVDMVQCQGFEAGEAKRCACPKLERCIRKSRKRSSSRVGVGVGNAICVKGQSGCKLLKHECDLVRENCAGEAWLRTDPVQCADFATGELKACACPCLKQCSHILKVCGVTHTSEGLKCRSFRSECELRRRSCMGEKWTLTSDSKCEGIAPGTNADCVCPQMRRCSQRQQSVCVRAGNQCKSFRTECDFKKALCRGEAHWRRTNAAHCCQFRLGESRRCTLTASEAVCGTTNNRSCRQFRTECELRNANTNAEQPWHAISRSRCKCFRPGQTKSCARPPLCRPRASSSSSPRDAPQVCGRQGQQRRLFHSKCDLLRMNYRLCSDFKPVRMRECSKLRRRS